MRCWTAIEGVCNHLRNHAEATREQLVELCASYLWNDYVSGDITECVKIGSRNTWDNYRFYLVYVELYELLEERGGKVWLSIFGPLWLRKEGGRFTHEDKDFYKVAEELIDNNFIIEDSQFCIKPDVQKIIKDLRQKYDCAEEAYRVNPNRRLLDAFGIRG